MFFVHHLIPFAVNSNLAFRLLTYPERAFLILHRVVLFFIWSGTGSYFTGCCWVRCPFRPSDVTRTLLSCQSLGFCLSSMNLQCRTWRPRVCVSANKMNTEVLVLFICSFLLISWTYSQTKQKIPFARPWTSKILRPIMKLRCVEKSRKKLRH